MNKAELKALAKAVRDKRQQEFSDCLDEFVGSCEQAKDEAGAVADGRYKKPAR